MIQTKKVFLPSENKKTRKLTEEIILFLEDKKIADILLLNLEKVNPYFCFFIIASANSSIQLRSVSRELFKKFSIFLDKNNNPLAEADSGWVIYDFIDIVVHLFLPETRKYYNLEKLWGDAPIIYSSETKTFQW